MRKAFRWTYERLAKGQSRRSILRQCKPQKALHRSVLEAFKKLDALTRFDRSAFADGTVLVGMDEVGRGPLAGPLIAACVHLPHSTSLLPYLRDSKKLKATERELLAVEIQKTALATSYGVVEASEFGGELNLHWLTFLAMQRALEALPIDQTQSALLVDGKYSLPSWSGPQKAVIKGDDLSLSIAAASVLAKVKRDEIMTRLDQDLPVYGFASHVGYGTEKHRDALRKYGPCPHHRKNFLGRILNCETDTGSRD